MWDMHRNRGKTLELGVFKKRIRNIRNRKWTLTNRLAKSEPKIVVQLTVKSFIDP